MPLSEVQLFALKDAATKIRVQEENPKKPGSKAYEPFDKYKAACTIGEASAAAGSLALKFIRAQKTNTKMQDAKFWASESCSRGERCRLKTVSKLCKFLIELGGFPPKDVIASYK